MKQFTRIDSIVQPVGLRFKSTVTVKKFQTEDGLMHEFTTVYPEDKQDGAIIALTKDRKVIVVYQFCAGPERWLHEIPGGRIEAGEDPQEGVLRELREETGYVPGAVEYLGESCRDGYSNAVWHYYLATDCVPTPEGPQLEQTELDQGVELRLLSIDEFLEYAKHDGMSDPAAVLMAYDKLKENTANGASN